MLNEYKMTELKNRIAVRYIFWIMPCLFLLLTFEGVMIWRAERADQLVHNEDIGAKLSRHVADTLKAWIMDQTGVARMISAEPLIIDVCLNPGSSEIAKKAEDYLRMIRRHFPYYENAALAIRLRQDEKIALSDGPDSRIIENGQFFLDTVDRQTVGKGGMDNRCIREVLEGKDYFISAAYPGMTSGSPVFAIAAPVKNGDTITGAAVIVLRMDYFSDLFIKNIRLDESGYGVMIDSRSLLISHPDKSLVLNPEASDKIKHLTAELLKGKMNITGMFRGTLKKYMACLVDLPADHTETQWYVGIGQNMDEIMSNLVKFIYILVGSGLLFFMVIIFMLVTITNRIFIRPIRNASTAACRLADYDLGVEIAMERTDEIGGLLAALQQMVERFREIVLLITGTTKNINDLTVDISENVSSQASVITQQSASVSEITSTMSELSASFSQIAGHADAVARLADDAHRQSESGAASVSGVMNQMEAISRNNRKNMNEMVELGQKSREIAKVMDVINNISDQTRLIAFNAALEASSAGEAGKRFGVVAAEIRRLAASVTQSTGEIGQKIREIQEAVNHMIISSEQGARGIDECLKNSNDTTEKLAEIVNGAHATADAARQISISTRQQKTASEQVVLALREIDTGGRQNTSAIKRFSDISQELAELSETLKSHMEKFRL